MLQEEQKKLTSAWAEKEGQEETILEDEHVVNREKMLNDLVNTGVMAALIGGFAFSNLSGEYDTTKNLDVAIYMCSCVAVHLCTCSSLTSALLYRSANFLSDEEMPKWASKQSMLLHFPIGKFVVGVISYICSVMLLAWKDLHGNTTFRYVALCIGLGSVSMIVSYYDNYQILVLGEHLTYLSYLYIGISFLLFT